MVPAYGESLEAWLESRVEDGGTGMLFVAVRRSLNRIANDAGLLARVTRRLQAEGRWGGEGKADGEAGEVTMELEGEIGRLGVAIIIGAFVGMQASFGRNWIGEKRFSGFFLWIAYF